MVNRVILIGNLGKEPEVRRLESGAVVAKFSVATNENFKDKSGEWQKQTEWHDVVVWRSMAERAERDLKKGSMVYLEGKLVHRKWQDQEGKNRKTTEVVGNYFRILNRKETSEAAGGYFPSSEDENKMSSNSNAPAPVQTKEVKEPAADDDLPF